MSGRKSSKNRDLSIAEIDAMFDEQTKEAKRKGAPSPVAGFSLSNENSDEDDRLYSDVPAKGRSSSEENDRKISARAQKKERAKGDHKISSSRQKLSDDHDLKPRAKAKVADQGRSSSGTAAKTAPPPPAGVKKSSSDTRKVAAKVSNRTGQKEQKTQPTGRASAESKASSTQAKKATKLDSKGESASSTSSRSLTCQKEGCNTKLTGRQMTRCEVHKSKCKKEGCNMAIKNHKLGVCNPHQKPPVTRICQKEGCNKILQARLKRCSDHREQCKKEGCKKVIQDRGAGLCHRHSHQK